jgi:hypothetical protein
MVNLEIWRFGDLEILGFGDLKIWRLLISRFGDLRDSADDASRNQQINKSTITKSRNHELTK